MNPSSRDPTDRKRRPTDPEPEPDRRGGSNSGARPKKARVQFAESRDDDAYGIRAKRKPSARAAPSSSSVRAGPGYGIADEDEDDEDEDDVDMDGDIGKPRKPRQSLRDAATGDSDDDEDADGDEDMFDDDDDDAKSKKRKGKILPLSEADLEAEVLGPTTTDFDNDDNGGIAIEPFNMRAEMRDGGFDEAGTYIRKADENARFDGWLAGVTDEDMEAAALAHKAREQQRQEHEAAVAARSAELARLGHHGMLMQLAGLLRPRESVTLALARLNRRIVRPALASRKKPAPSLTEPEPEPLSSKWAREDVALITDLADRLLAADDAHAMPDVYAAEYEDLVSDLRDDGHVPRDWVPVHPRAADRAITYTYAWDAEPGSERYGPFPADDMQAWADDGYFDEQPIWLQRFLNGVPLGEPWMTVPGEKVEWHEV
ncbi:hypothetical protein H9P43_000520 [Blastocladiella emersonii ATCC 22665]|nr:hypothetical protein H9P43_000520 [Blastocladiella emersonii ATCC 22665]